MRKKFSTRSGKPRGGAQDKSSDSPSEIFFESGLVMKFLRKKAEDTVIFRENVRPLRFSAVH